MAKTQNPVRFRLGGRFAVFAPDGAVLTPRSAKAQAVLALLALSPTFDRGRLWLQGLLWATRGPEQAAASLRQALAEIRRALADHADLLQADRQGVTLTRDLIDVQLPEGEAELLEGMLLREPAFDSWLRQERVRLTGRPAHFSVDAPGMSFVQRPQATRPAILFVADTADRSPMRLFEDLFIDVVARSLREALSVDVYTLGSLPRSERVVKVVVQSFRPDPQRIGLRARIEDSGTHLLHWSGAKTTEARGAPPIDDPEMVVLGNQLIDALADALTLPRADHTERRDANLLGRLALRKIFTMRPAELLAADALLAEAYAMDPRAAHLAWRAQLRAIQLVERHAGCSQATRDEAEALCQQALEAEAGNSMVLAAVSNARIILDEDVIACQELARRSVELNPANPLAWDSLATAKLYAGQFEAAHLLAVKAQQLSATAPHKFWWDMGRCITAALTGRADEAMRMAEISGAQSPDFRPPLRYLTAMYAARGMEEEALRMAKRLQKLEPDFTIEALAKDMNYPVGALRRSDLLKADRLLALGNG